MGSYSGQIDRPSRTKAITGVVAVHVALAAIILTGLNVAIVRQAVEHMTTINIAEPPPPPPTPKAERAKAAEGAPAKRATPTDIVAPPPILPAPSPVVAAPVAGTGNAPSAGAALAGTGTGAGGSGNGPGGGGYGDTSGFTPARLVRNLSRGDYSSIAGGRLPAGSADMAIAIGPDGSVSDCRIIRSSGDRAIDAGLCPLVMRRLRFRPALDASGRAIAYRTNFHARWQLGY